jgi:hypothetical protein
VKGAAIGFAIGLIGGTAGAVIAAGFLAYGAYKLATGGYKDVAAGAERLFTGKGTASDYEAAAGIVGGIVGGGAAGIVRGSIGGTEGAVAKAEAEAAARAEADAAATQARMVAQLRLRQRQVELGTDPVRGLIEREGAGGVHIEQGLGRQITRSADPAADFVDKVLGPISLKGPIPAGGDLQGLAKSAVKDAFTNTYTKALFVDLTGLSTQQAAIVEQLVRVGTQGATKQIFFLH